MGHATVMINAHVLLNKTKKGTPTPNLNGQDQIVLYVSVREVYLGPQSRIRARIIQIANAQIKVNVIVQQASARVFQALRDLLASVVFAQMTVLVMEHVDPIVTLLMITALQKQSNWEHLKVNIYPLISQVMTMHGTVESCMDVNVILVTAVRIAQWLSALHVRIHSMLIVLQELQLEKFQVAVDLELQLKQKFQTFKINYKLLLVTSDGRKHTLLRI